MASLEKSEQLAAEGKHVESFREAADVARQALKDLERELTKNGRK